MGEDCGSWLPRQHFDWQSSNWNSLTAPLDLGRENTVFAHMNPGTNMVPMNENFTLRALTELPNQRMGQANEPHGWFYCLPQFRQGFTHVPISTVKDKALRSPHEHHVAAVPPNVESGCAEKRFLVFDQSRDQTTMIFGSNIRKPIHFPSWIKQFPGAYNLNGEIAGPKSDINHPLGPILTGKTNENHDSDDSSEMHEDTEELNALLYSDDGSDYTEDDDDEVTSTGHSPGSMTDNGNKSDWLEGSTKEEVASCNMQTRKRKQCHEGYDDKKSLDDTASSGNIPKRSAEHEADAESGCGGGSNSAWSDEMDSSCRNKRMRKEKIKETINILQRIVPSGKGKDAIVVLDEAIQYLNSLKLKAIALGLGTL